MSHMDKLIAKNRAAEAAKKAAARKSITRTKLKYSNVYRMMCASFAVTTNDLGQLEMMGEVINSEDIPARVMNELKAMGFLNPLKIDFEA